VKALAALLLAGAAAAAPATPPIELKADARVELLGVLQTLAGGGRASPAEKARILARYGRWKESPAVAGLRAIEGKNGRRSPLALIAPFLTEPPELAWTSERGDLPDAFVDAAGGAAALETFLADARAFARASRFAEDFRARAARRAKEEAAARAELGGRDPFAALLDYLGRPLDARMSVVLSDVFEPGEMNSFVIPYPSRERGRPRRTMRVVTVLTPTPEGGWGLGPPTLGRIWNEPLYAALEYDLDAFEPRLAAASAPRLAVGDGCPPSPEACGRHLIVAAVARRLDARWFGSEPSAPAAGAPCAERAAAALADALRDGRERGRPARLADALPDLVARLETPLCGKAP